MKKLILSFARKILELTTVDNGKLNVTVDTQLFRGVHYELSTYDKDGNEWLVHSTKKAEVGSIGWT